MNASREFLQVLDGGGETSCAARELLSNVVALRCLGLPDDDPEFIWAMQQLDDLMIAEGDTLRLQPCKSPVWDTALTLIGLADAGVPAHADAVRRGVDWLLDREIRRPGDWSLANRGVEPAGWVFEYRNGFYPDTDDTAMVLMALARSDAPFRQPIERGLRWLLAMQNRDGGWAAFDRDNDHEVLTKVPFADHNAMLDPPTVDITGRVLEMLATYGYTRDDKRVRRAIDFILREQEPDGSWFGRWPRRCLQAAQDCFMCWTA